MAENVYLQVGDSNVVVAAGNLPPVGTRIHVHKCLTADGGSVEVEVTAHEWRLEEPEAEAGLPAFSIMIRTKRVR